MATLFASESYINATVGYRYGDSGVQETFCETPGELYRAMRREHGRCIGRTYIDTPDGTEAIGWVFTKRVMYDDARPRDGRYGPDAYYLREVWVTVHDAPDTVTRTPHYHYID